MYRLNPLHRNVLITTDEVIAKAPIDADADLRLLSSAIEIAEERFIAPILCDALYEDFIDQKNVLVTIENKADLTAKVNTGNTGEQIVLVEGMLINAIELVVDEWYKKLWNRFLWKIVAECVAYTAIPSNSTRTTSQGEMQNNPASPMGGQGAASADLRNVKWKMDKVLQDRIDPLIEAMRKWMCRNKSNFPKWNCSDCGCDEPDGVSISRKTGWIHGIYDDDEKEDCECND